MAGGIADSFAASFPHVAPALVLLLVFLIAWMVVEAFRSVGFTFWEVALLLFLAPLVEGVNIPVYREGDVILAVNLAGAVIPSYIALRAVGSGRAPWPAALVGVGFVGIIMYQYATIVPGQGIVAPALLPVLVAGFVAVPLSYGRWHNAGVLAYVSGAMGALLGADLLNVRALLGMPVSETTVISIGGAGTQDGIFVVGLAAVVIDMLVIALLRLVGGDERRVTRA